jgi:hypothetical protein
MVYYRIGRLGRNGADGFSLTSGMTFSEEHLMEDDAMVLELRA